MLTIDTHAHAWDKSCIYVANSRYRPDYFFTAEAYLQKLSTYGMHKGVLVQPSFLGTDNTYLLKALNTYPTHLRGVVVVDKKISKESLFSMHQSGVRGIRYNLINQPIPSFCDAEFQELFSYIQSLGWHVELHAKAIQWQEIIQKLGNTSVKIVIDHFGRPENGVPTCKGLQALLVADLDLHVKLSAPYRFGARAINPLIEVWEARVGKEKLLWGSDTPFTQHEEVWNFERSLSSLGKRFNDLSFLVQLDINAKRLFCF
ncbi:MAG: amidohydrolase family protein [Sulfurospirillaceae bacterium]|jgi:predicted TIM-barrel fold metal-dependent hydrolase|nr:amidohydrolase family protein [Sulfurospirillaceae bacterium]MDD2826132.1 amidohydrolase family protein [Sulfurospirillaceae bacterium]